MTQYLVLDDAGLLAGAARVASALCDAALAPIPLVAGAAVIAAAAIPAIIICTLIPNLHH